MRCPSCDFDNPEEMKFCGGCGAALQQRCPQCAAENTARFRFCGACGAPLTGQTQAPQPTPAEAERAPLAAQTPQLAPASAERRQLTVLFCDLVDSTALATELDPEDLREVVRAYQRVCAGVIQRFEGYIAQYLGDGLLVYFGYPRAHEDDSQRAVRAALGMVQAMGPLNQHLEQAKGVRLAIRVGIHTGLVVVGEVGGSGRQEQLALGDTPNVAARLQDLAAPDTVVISAATQRLVRGWFVCHELGLHTLKGVATPMPVFHVLQESDEPSRLDVAAGGGLTPLVGREQEVGLLLERWALVKDGRGQVVLLSGEAGIGKSRLLQVVTERIVSELHTRIEWRASPYHQQSPLYPVIVYLHRRLGWSPEESPQEKLRKLETVLHRYGFSLSDVVSLFASLLALPLPDHYPPLALAPQRQKQQTLETLLLWLLRETEQHPVLFIMEDLHWLDPSTLEFLNLLVEQAATMRMFTLFTCRPTFLPPWDPHAHLTHLTLSRLSHRQAALMIDQVARGKALPAEVQRQLLTKTDGVPLFVEELTKMVLESGFLTETEERYELTGPLPTLAIPATLHDSLIARLDRLNTAKTVAQLGAAIGRQFSYELLRSVWPTDEATLQHALGQLVETEMLHQRGLPPQATYTFKHALIQEAAYQSLLRSRRQQYHQQIAHALVERFPQTVETQPELLAYHYTEAGLAAQAVPYWQRAGQRAIERSANVEAISHLTKGLEALKALPDTPERTHQELTLQLALGAPLLMIKGHTAPEVERAYARAYELAQQLGETPQRFSVLVGLWRFYLSQARLHTARELGEECFALAQHLRDQVFLQEAHQMLGSTLFFLGELVAAHTHLEQGITLYDPEQSRTLAFSRGTDPGVVCLSRAAWALWSLGYPDRALARSHEAIALAQRLSHPYSLSFALQYNAILHMWRREIALVKERAEATMALMQEHGFVQFWGGAITKLGWVLVEQGAIEQGIAQILQGLDAQKITGVELGRHENFVILAHAYRRARQAKEGLRVLAEAMTIVHNNAERFYEAELYRLKGELLLQSGSEDLESDLPPSHSAPYTPQAEEAETCFRQAIALARHQSAKSLELRAVMSLSRLWQHQGRQAATRQMLAEIYSWFTEGFDTPDLQEAKALLEALQ